MSSIHSAVIETNLPIGTPIRGKVRDCYQLQLHDEPHMLIVSTDRVSAFDWVLPTPIPDKGKILTAVSKFWFDWLSEQNQSISHHLVTTDVGEMGLPATVDLELLRDRSMLVKTADVIPFECVVRGWLAGSGLVEYQKWGTVCGISLPSNLRSGDRLPSSVFTPATKAVEGHDENISFETMAKSLGESLASELREQSILVYEKASTIAERQGIVLADTKFEWGYDKNGQLMLIDEVLTPDSSRFWPSGSVGKGNVPESFDKQFVRDWLVSCDWDRTSPPPPLPPEIVDGTRQKYLDVCHRLTGSLPC
ncbi:MAG: phosphoribosylaminoimidazolesuccinocarboxamide synthase [Planctomycetaceae bacterium]|nr:phosphoribosylaminoimidazolesuccinocarboxamide synthase [Planctomycetaceae bacterium]MBT7728265.1 phosphoribosylaminoimidazolesuccinocarboxamide synthase [Planctomycetaceae bacterium]